MIKCNKTNTSYILYTIIGEKNKIDSLCDILNKNNKDNTISYISTKTIFPIRKKSAIIEKEKNIVLEICDFCEEVQANLYCYYQDENSYMIICIKYEKFKYYLTYPKFNIEQINNPNFDLVIKLVGCDNIYAFQLIKTVSLISTIGPNRQILLFVSKLVEDDNYIEGILDILMGLTSIH